MTPWTGAPSVRAFLARASRRRSWITAAEGSAAGFALALALLLSGWPGRTAAAVLLAFSLAVLGAAAGVAWRQRHAPRVSFSVERRAPECRNVVVTADELIADPARVPPYVGSMVCNEAARVIARLDLAALFPARRAGAMLALSIALWALAVAFGDAELPAPTRVTLDASVPVAVTRVDVSIIPPEYSGLPARTLRDPARIDALEGSRIHIVVRANADTVALETLSGSRVLSAGTESFEGDVVADADGFIAVEPAGAGGRRGARRLIGLSVTRDRAPRVRLTAPGTDLFLPDTRRTLAVTIETDDDLGLASLRLRYTKVSGSGELFTFTDGDLPIAITRTDVRAWNARGTLQLATLGLQAGDMLVYRGVATDRRPGAPPSESDSYIIEITAPGAVAAEGFAIDNDEDRYAISQQMVILKTERLIARRASLHPDSLAYESLGLAAEQRAVRAEFVFMMGGELAEEILAAAGMSDLNEVAEAEAEDDVLAGRLANQGRLALVRAIRSMSRANAALTATDLTQALKDEKSALEYLQAAFARARYILRALTQRERLDLSRRLTGVLSAVGRNARPSVESRPDSGVVSLRRALADVATLAGEPELGGDESARATVIAQRVLRIDPSAIPLQDVATRLARAAEAMTGPGTTEARALLDSAAIALSTAVRRELPPAPRGAAALDVNRLAGALSDALRRR